MVKPISVPLRDLKGPEEWSEGDLHKAIKWRIAHNLEHTGHPFHHETADGTIVDADPTLEQWASLLKTAAPAVPVDRLFYARLTGQISD